ncbi:hypothetical protein J3459_011808 [Metarhizium acridum]|uniref:uncharacterized protein n=1 Tax=Metarhizium acridum TaxID=92637 RepID=UPI001C6C1F26|nr:hypothetical protein J3458_009388 [Metarhizium acridum]KAG8419026.1 hypothetical protein J3459_011808 [Metarhizium acridum]
MAVELFHRNLLIENVSPQMRRAAVSRSQHDDSQPSLAAFQPSYDPELNCSHLAGSREGKHKSCDVIYIMVDDAKPERDLVEGLDKLRRVLSLQSFFFQRRSIV